MRVIRRVLCLGIVSCPLIGCGDPAASDATKTATAANPQVAVDMAKQMGPPTDSTKKDADKSPKAAP